MGSQFREKVEKRKSARVVNILKMFDSSTASFSAKATSSRPGSSPTSSLAKFSITEPESETNRKNRQMLDEFWSVLFTANFDEKDEALKLFFETVDKNVAERDRTCVKTLAEQKWSLAKILDLKAQLQEMLNISPVDRAAVLKVQLKLEILEKNSNFKLLSEDKKIFSTLEADIRVTIETLRFLSLLLSELKDSWSSLQKLEDNHLELRKMMEIRQNDGLYQDITQLQKQYETAIVNKGVIHELTDLKNQYGTGDLTTDDYADNILRIYDELKLYERESNFELAMSYLDKLLEELVQKMLTELEALQAIKDKAELLAALQTFHDKYDYLSSLTEEHKQKRDQTLRKLHAKANAV